VLCKHEVTGSIPVGSTSSRAGSTIRLAGSRPVSLPVRSRDRGKTDIVKRAKHETFWVRPEWGFGRVPSPRGSGAFGSSSGEAAGQPRQSFQVNDTDREGGVDLRIVAASDMPRGVSGQVDFRPERERVAAEPAAHKRARLLLDRIKREKGVWWMPWQQEAMKDVALCDKPGGGESTLRSRDLRMGQPT
jgi:hypothetical protein